MESGIQLQVPSGYVPLEVARSRRARRRGLLGRERVDGALLLERTSSVHTIGMRVPIDVAHLDASLRVLRISTMAPHRLGRRVAGARHVLEAGAGAFALWGIRVGVTLAVAGDTHPGVAA